MLKIIKRLINKETILYVVFGVLTTLINIAIFHLFNETFALQYLVANIIAWTASVIFAYVTNKFFVFQSKNVRGKYLLKEFGLFIAARLISLGMDELGMYLLVDAFACGEMLSKIIMNVIVIISNYIFSKLIIFNKKTNR